MKRKSPAGAQALLVLCSPGQHCHHKLLPLQPPCSTATGAAIWSALGCRTTRMLQTAVELVCFSTQQFVSLSKHTKNHIQSELLNSSLKCKQPQLPWTRNPQPPEMPILTTASMSTLLGITSCSTNPQLQTPCQLHLPSILAMQLHILPVSAS